MLVLGLQGSPRRRGNTERLLARFLEACSAAGARTETIAASREHILPCRGCGYCEKKGRCIIDDDFMAAKGYHLLRSAEVVVAATPVFFYNMSAQLKALVDRTQALWSRKYRFEVADPAAGHRKGLLLSVGASRGKTLFDAITLSTRYFFDAIDASYAGSLLYRGVEAPGDVDAVEQAAKDIRRAVAAFVVPLASRPKVVVAGKRNDATSQMAAAMLQRQAGERLEVHSAGQAPAERIDPDSVTAMEEIGIDMAFARPSELTEKLSTEQPGVVIRTASLELPALPSHVTCHSWQTADSAAGDGRKKMQRIRDGLQEQVDAFLAAGEAGPGPPRS